MSVWACIATGPSLTLEDVEKLRGRVRTIAVNDAYKMAPWADALYAADLRWWHVHDKHVAKDFEGRKFSVENHEDSKNPAIARQLYGCTVFKQASNKQIRNDGLSNKHNELRLGGLSGYQAINLAYLWGAKVILLLGYDMQSTGGRRHFFGDHPSPLINGGDYHKRVAHFESIQPEKHGIEIVNCTRQTALECFPRMSVDEALAKYA